MRDTLSRGSVRALTPLHGAPRSPALPLSLAAPPHARLLPPDADAFLSPPLITMTPMAPVVAEAEPPPSHLPPAYHVHEGGAMVFPSKRPVGDADVPRVEHALRGMLQEWNARLDISRPSLPFAPGLWGVMQMIVFDIRCAVEEIRIYDVALVETLRMAHHYSPLLAAMLSKACCGTLSQATPVTKRSLTANPPHLPRSPPPPLPHLVATSSVPAPCSPPIPRPSPTAKCESSSPSHSGESPNRRVVWCRTRAVEAPRVGDAVAARAVDGDG